MRLWGILALNIWVVDWLLAVGVVLVFGRAYRGGWVFDDWSIYDEEREFQAGSYYRHWRQYFNFRPTAGRPFTYLGYQLTYSFFGFNLEAWHLVNLWLHILAVLLLHHLAAALGASSAAAAAIAAIFAFHPLQVPTVCYISGRPGLQSVLFTIAGLLCFQLGAWPASIVLQYIAWKSKEDSILFWVFYPIFYFLFT
jgi:hypothetical protein